MLPSFGELDDIVFFLLKQFNVNVEVIFFSGSLDAHEQ